MLSSKQTEARPQPPPPPPPCDNNDGAEGGAVAVEGVEGKGVAQEGSVGDEEPSTSDAAANAVVCDPAMAARASDDSAGDPAVPREGVDHLDNFARNMSDKDEVLCLGWIIPCACVFYLLCQESMTDTDTLNLTLRRH